MKPQDYFAALAASQDQTLPAGVGATQVAVENSAAATQSETGAGLPTITPAPTPSVDQAISTAVDAVADVPKAVDVEAQTEIQKLEKRVVELEHQIGLLIHHSRFMDRIHAFEKTVKDFIGEL